jgi:hypothetical protein
MRQDTVEAAIAAVANKATYAGSGAALYGGWTANEMAAIGGLICAAIGVAIQWYYKRKADRREAELHQERLSEIRSHK